MPDTDTVRCIRSKFEALRPLMSERLRRHWAAAEAASLGRGGITTVATATGMSRATITQGLRELAPTTSDAAVPSVPPGRSRRVGGGRRPLTQTDPTVLSDLNGLVDPSTRGDPQSPLRWNCKSTRRLAQQLREAGHRIGERAVAALLKGQGYSLQGNRKTKEGGGAPGPRRPVRAHRQARPVVPAAGPARRLGRC